MKSPETESGYSPPHSYTPSPQAKPAPATEPPVDAYAHSAQQTAGQSADHLNNDPGAGLSGRRLGHFRLGPKLGGGVVSAVYQAIDETTQQPVAIKTLLSGADEVMRERFRREAELVSSLHHRHIVTTLEVGETAVAAALNGHRESVAYIAMELAEGYSLAQLLERHGRISASDAAAILAPIGEALEYAHRQDIVHRDVKPSNILLRREQGNPPGSVRISALEQAVTPLLTDFGIARALDAPELTNAGRTIGTPAFMSPEQCAGEDELDGRSDIYGLGAVLYRCVVGKTPYLGSTTQMLYAHVYEPLLIPEEMVALLPPIALATLQRAMMKDPAQRYQSAAAMAADLAVASGRAPADGDLSGATHTVTMAALPAVRKEGQSGSARVLVPSPVASVPQAAQMQPSFPPDRNRTTSWTSGRSPERVTVKLETAIPRAIDSPAPPRGQRRVLRSRTLGRTLDHRWGRAAAMLVAATLLIAVGVTIFAIAFSSPQDRLLPAFLTILNTPADATPTTLPTPLTQDIAAQPSDSQPPDVQPATPDEPPAATPSATPSATPGSTATRSAAAATQNEPDEPDPATTPPSSGVNDGIDGNGSGNGSSAINSDVSSDIMGDADSDIEEREVPATRVTPPPAETPAPTRTPTPPPVDVELDTAWASAQTALEAENWEEAVEWLLIVRQIDAEFEADQIRAELTRIYTIEAQAAYDESRLDAALEWLILASAEQSENNASLRLAEAYLAYQAEVERAGLAGTPGTDTAPPVIDGLIMEELHAALADAADALADGSRAALDDTDAACLSIFYDSVTLELANDTTATDEGTSSGLADLLLADLIEACNAGRISLLPALTGRLIYSSQDGDRYRSYVMPVTAPGSSALLIDAASQPRLRHDSRTAAFFSWHNGGPQGLFGLDLGGGQSAAARTLQFTNHSEDSRDSPPSWSPTGDRLAFASTRANDDRHRVYITSADANHAAQELRLGKDPAWHPWQDLLVFNGVDAAGQNPGLYLMATDGTQLRQLTDNGNDMRPAWSPNGEHIVFMSSGRHGNWELYRLDLATLAITRLTFSEAQDGLPAVSPDGNYVAFASDRAGFWEFWYVPISGGDSIRLASMSGQLVSWLEHGLQWLP